VPSSLPEPRGDLSEQLIHALGGAPSATEFDPPTASDPLANEDSQLALYVLYELHYDSFEGVDDGWEWEPSLQGLRRALERDFADALHELVPPPAVTAPQALGDQLFEIVGADESPPLSRFLEMQATREQFREFVIHRSAYQLKEADPHTWAIPRLRGGAKAALVEIQADEYGQGRERRMHSVLFAETMAALGLDAEPGAYLDCIPGSTLATVNLVTMFGLQRRWRGALVGHLAVFEMTSALANRRYGNGLRRLGCGPQATAFYDEHVEADSVHENIAAHDLAGGLARQEPELAGDILFGAASLLALDARAAQPILDAWGAGESSLHQPLVVR